MMHLIVLDGNMWIYRQIGIILNKVSFKMKNFFDWEYNYDSFNDKDDKCLQNTDHTTGNAF